MAVFSV